MKSTGISASYVKRDSTEKLQSSLEAQSADPVKAYEELDDRILKFESLNAFAAPMEVDELSGGEALEKSLFNNSSNFHKTCSPTIGKERLEKAIKQREMQNRFGTLENHSALKEKWKLWPHPVFIMSSHSYRHFFYPDDSASRVLSENSRTGLMNLFRTAGFPVFQFL